MARSSNRYALLDELRGLDLISMMLYHGMWDVVFLFRVPVGWYTALPGHLWQQSICWVFILLSGFCLSLGHHPYRRGSLVFGAGALVTLVTALFMPEDIVLFGVLTLIGSAMILTALLEKPLRKVPPAVGAVVSFLLFVLTYSVQLGWFGVGTFRWMLPKFLYANLFTAYVGFYSQGFYSTDYFPLLPWLFLFWVGFYLYHLLKQEQLECLRTSLCPPLGWLGRHSLVLYLLHQPVLFAVLNLVFFLLR